MNLRDKRIILGVTGSVAVYKALDVASLLGQVGAIVDVIMTDRAQEFISPLTFQSITGRKVYTKMFTDPDRTLEQMYLAERADLVVIAPITANFVAKMTTGVADDLLSLIVLATKAPVVVAPAMTANMYANSTTQDNLVKLTQRGVIEIPPDWGYLIGGFRGKGRLAGCETIVDTLRQVLGEEGDLKDVKVVITAGGTRESLGKGLFLANPASGKMGMELAREFRDNGALVTLIEANTREEPPVGTRVLSVDSTQELFDTVLRESENASVLVMAASLPEYLPRKSQFDPENGIAVKKTPNIFQLVSKDLITVGFVTKSAGFSKDAAIMKLYREGLDIIVASRSQGGGGYSQISLIEKDGSVTNLPLQTKEHVAREVIRKVIKTLKPNS